MHHLALVSSLQENTVGLHAFCYFERQRKAARFGAHRKRCWKIHWICPACSPACNISAQKKTPQKRRVASFELIPLKFYRPGGWLLYTSDEDGRALCSQFTHLPRYVARGESYAPSRLVSIQFALIAMLSAQLTIALHLRERIRTLVVSLNQTTFTWIRSKGHHVFTAHSETRARSLCAFYFSISDLGLCHLFGIATEFYQELDFHWAAALCAKVGPMARLRLVPKIFAARNAKTDFVFFERSRTILFVAARK